MSVKSNFKVIKHGVFSAAFLLGAGFAGGAQALTLDAFPGEAVATGTILVREDGSNAIAGSPPNGLSFPGATGQAFVGSKPGELLLIKAPEVYDAVGEVTYVWSSPSVTDWGDVYPIPGTNDAYFDPKDFATEQRFVPIQLNIYDDVETSSISGRILIEIGVEAGLANIDDVLPTAAVTAASTVITIDYRTACQGGNGVTEYCEYGRPETPVSYNNFSTNPLTISANNVTAGEIVSLDASASYDEDLTDTDGIVSYNWNYVGGTYVATGVPVYGLLTQPLSGATPSFTAPEIAGRVASEGNIDEEEGVIMNFELTVTDDEGYESETMYLAFHVTTPKINSLPENSTNPSTVSEYTGAPIARAGADQTVRSGETVILDGSASPWNVASNGLGLYRWEPDFSNPASVILTNLEDSQPYPRSSAGANVGPGTNALKASFEAPAIDYGGEPVDLNFIFRMEDDTSDDDNADIDFDVMTVTVLPPADGVAPTAVIAGADVLEHYFGDTISLDGSGSSDDLDNNITGYKWNLISSTDPTIRNLSDLGVSTFSGSSLTFDAPAFSDDVTLVVSLTVSDDGQFTETGNPNTGMDQVTIMLSEEDIVAPVARTAFGDRDIASGTVISEVIDGSPSSDNFGAIETFEWTLKSAKSDGVDVTVDPAIVLTPSVDGAKVSFNVPTVEAGESDLILTFELKVTDAVGLEDIVEVAITVKAEIDEEDPIAMIAGRDRDVLSGSEVTLDGSGSLDNVEIVSYEWTIMPEDLVGLDLTDPSKPTFTAPTVEAHEEAIELEVTLTVKDALGNEDTAEVTLTVLAGDDTEDPVAIAEYSEIVVSAGESVELDGTFSRDNLEIFKYDWVFAGSTSDLVSEVGMNFSADGSKVLITAPTLPDGTPNVDLTFTLTVEDEAGNSDSTDVIVTVVFEELENVAPEAVISGGDITVASGAEVTLDGSDSSDNFEIVSFSWGVTPADMVTFTLNTEEEFTFTAPFVAYGSDDVELLVTLTVFDAAGNFGTETITITVESEVVPANAPEIEETQTAIANFVQARAAHTIAAQPDLIGFLSSAGADGTFNANVTQGNTTFDLGTSSEEQGVWLRTQGSWSSSDGLNNGYFFGAVGGHLDVSPNMIAGLMLQFDSLTQESSTTTTSGNGYLVGPYFVAQSPNQPLFFEGRYLLGASTNTTSINDAEEQEFETSRSLLQAKISGQIVSHETTWTPSVAFAHVTETQDAFTDNYGREIAKQGVAVSSATVGLDFATPISVKNGDMQLSGGVSGSWFASDNSGFASTITPDYEGASGSLHLGTVYTFSGGTVLSAGMTYSGLFNDFQSTGLNFGLSKEF